MVQALAELELRRRRGTAKPIWAPNTGPQTDAYTCEAEELNYGGGAGSGKTDLLIGLALTRHRQTRIFRREYPQLANIIDRLGEICPGRLNQSTHRLKTSDGRIVRLASVPHEKDKTKYQGAGMSGDILSKAKSFFKQLLP